MSDSGVDVGDVAVDEGEEECKVILVVVLLFLSVIVEQQEPFGPADEEGL